MKINVNNEVKIKKAVAFAQRNARVRCINHKDIVEYVKQIEDKLKGMGVAKKDWLGAKFRIDDNAFKKPACYMGSPESTIFELERFKSGWFITSMHRRSTQPKQVSFINEPEYKKHYSIEWS